MSYSTIYTFLSNSTVGRKLQIYTQIVPHTTAPTVWHWISRLQAISSKNRNHCVPSKYLKKGQSLWCTGWKLLIILYLKVEDIYYMMTFIDEWDTFIKKKYLQLYAICFVPVSFICKKFWYIVSCLNNLLLAECTFSPESEKWFWKDYYSLCSFSRLRLTSSSQQFYINEHIHLALWWAEWNIKNTQ